MVISDPVNGVSFRSNGVFVGSNADHFIEGVVSEVDMLITFDRNYGSAVINETIILNEVPSSEEILRLEGYVAHKWGIVAQLPSNHKYKDVAPARY